MASHYLEDKNQIHSLAPVILVSLILHHTPHLVLAPASWTTSRSWIVPYAARSAQSTSYPTLLS